MLSPISRRSGTWFESIQTEISFVIPNETLSLTEQAPITSPIYAQVPNGVLSLTEQAIQHSPLYLPNEVLSLNSEVPSPRLLIASPVTSFILAAQTPIPAFGRADVALTLPEPTLYAVGNDKDNARVSLTLEPPTLIAYTGAVARTTLLAPTLTAAATSPGFATVALELPEPELTATAMTGKIGGVALTLPELTLTAATGAYASLSLPAPQLAVVGRVGYLARVELTLPFLELTASATTGAVATITLELEEPLLLASGIVGSTSTVSLTLPALILTAYSTDVVTETTYAVNLNTGAVTNLLLGKFTKLVSAHGRLYGLRNGALVKLEGDADGATVISATVRFAPQTFGTNQAKRMSDVYLSSREDDGVTLTLVADEINQWHYQTNTDTAPAYGTHKIKVGRGIKFHTAGLILQNRNGGRMDIGGMELLVDRLSPRPKT